MTSGKETFNGEEAIKRLAAETIRRVGYGLNTVNEAHADLQAAVDAHPHRAELQSALAAHGRRNFLADARSLRRRRDMI